MGKVKSVKIDFSRKRLATQADKFYNEGNYLSALRFAYKELELYEGDGDVFMRLCDIYEGMGLHSSAINWWYRFLDVAEDFDLPDVYEGLAVNYMNIGNESVAAYYYGRLVDSDEQMPLDVKAEIATAFSKKKGDGFRFVYPPQAADYSKEIDAGAKALKMGNCKLALSVLQRVEKGAQEYPSAMEMQAVAYLLNGETQKAEEVCNELLQEKPNDIRVCATLAAVYLEQGREKESKELAYKLYALEQTDAEDLYKVATVCCENGLHLEAYEKFCRLEEKTPYDGRMLYFKAVAAYKCGKYKESELAFDALCAIYLDAEVAKYYLKALREWKENGFEGSIAAEPTYFYQLPQEERELRIKTMAHIGNAPQEEAQILGIIAFHDGYFRWAFDEMDGADHELQYLALVTAEHIREDGFLREAFLDNEVLDVLKIEILRLLYERNEEDEFGVVLCDIYRNVFLERIAVGRKKRKRFVEAHARVASKFAVMNPAYGRRIKEMTEIVYTELEGEGKLDLVDSADDLACAIFLLCGLKEMRGGTQAVAAAFGAKAENVEKIISAVNGGCENKTKEEEKK